MKKAQKIQRSTAMRLDGDKREAPLLFSLALPLSAEAVLLIYSLNKSDKIYLISSLAPSAACSIIWLAFVSLIRDSVCASE